MKNPIPTFIVNLKKRTDRRQHIESEFYMKKEFNVSFVEPVDHVLGTMSLWLTIVNLIKKNLDKDYILICEDDHQFTSHYSFELLLEAILQAERQEADVLSGGVSWVKSPNHIIDELYWMECFTGFQFTIIYKRFYEVLINALLPCNAAPDIFIGEISKKMYFVYPFISTQKEFGYSDLTDLNNLNGRVDKLFYDCENSVSLINQVAKYYKNQSDPEVENTFDDIFLSTYIINLPERRDRLAHIQNQFEGRKEFDTTIVQAIKHKHGNVGLWLTMREILKTAIEAEEDLIVICEDDHTFTIEYDSYQFIKTVIQAHNQGVDMISGGIGGFGSAIKISSDRFWINDFYCTQFTVIFKKAFQKLLDEPFDDHVTADGLLSEVLSNKNIIYPFISVQTSIGHSNINEQNNINARIEHLFAITNEKLKTINSVINT